MFTLARFAAQRKGRRMECWNDEELGLVAPTATAMGAGAAAGRTGAATAGDGDRRRGVGGEGRELFG